METSIPFYYISDIKQSREFFPKKQNGKECSVVGNLASFLTADSIYLFVWLFVYFWQC